MEPIEGIFSSPEKPRSSSHKSNGNHTNTDEVDMELADSGSNLSDREDIRVTNTAQGSAIEPAQARKSNGHRLLPPPRSRSPIKTSLGSSPRRSVGPMSSPRRDNRRTPSRSLFNNSSSAAFADETMPELLPTVEQSPRRVIRSSPLLPPAANNKSKVNKPAKKGRKRPFELSDDEENDEDTGEALAMETENDALGESQTEDLPPPENTGRLGVTDVEEDQFMDTTQDVDSEVEEQVAAPVEKRGRQKKADKPQAAAAAAPVPRKSKRASKEKAVTPPQSPVAATNSTPKRRGRPPKNPKPDVFREPGEEVEAGPLKPSKRAKTDLKAQTTATKATKRKPPPSQRDPNASIVSAEAEDVPTAKGRGKGKGEAKAKAATATAPPESPKTVTSNKDAQFAKPNTIRGKPRGLFVMRGETPAAEIGAQTLRSGRTSVKPLNYWMGEKYIRAPPRFNETGRISIGEIEEVLRAEEIAQPKRSRKRGPKRRLRKEVDEDEEDEDEEEWEQETGVLEAPVMQWDAELEKAVEDNLEEVGMLFIALLPTTSLLISHSTYLSSILISHH